MKGLTKVFSEGSAIMKKRIGNNRIAKRINVGKCLGSRLVGERGRGGLIQ